MSRAQMVSHAACLGVGLVLAVTGLVAADLAFGLALLAMALGLLPRLLGSTAVLIDSLATTLFAALTQATVVALAFLAWSDLWLTASAGFGATVLAVVLAARPYLDRMVVPEEEDARGLSRLPERQEGREVTGDVKRLLLYYSQLLVVANLLITTHTLRTH
jgi:hypothetical protein